jgi:hypothetical protein
MIDEIARDLAITRYGLAECMHVPIGAVDEKAISTYVGEVQKVLSGGSARTALLVLARPPPERDARFPIWDVDGCDILHRQLQVWVDVGYTRYRRAYRAAFPTEELGDRILSHTMNRRIAALQGFQFVRLTPTSRAANSSSAFSEGWGVALHSTPEQMARNRKRGLFIRYADLSELMLMMDMRLGGGVMDAVNEGQKLIIARTNLMSPLSMEAPGAST